MSTTITWKIENLERRTSDDFVYTAHWRCNGVDGEHYGTVYGTVSFDGDVKIPYEDLTEAQVIGWVHASMGEETVAAHEANVQAQIDAQKTPATASGTPWGQA